MTSLTNILNYIEKKGYSNSWFEEQAGLGNATLNNSLKRNADLTSKNIEKISKRFGEELISGGYCILDLSAFGRKGLAIIKQREAPGNIIAEKGKSTNILVDTTVEKLSGALADQAKANRDQAEGYKTLAEAYKEMLELMRDMRKEVAREDTQAKVNDKVDEVLSNLADAKKVEYLASKHLDSKFLEISNLLLKSVSHKKVLSRDADSKPDGNAGGVEKPRRKR